MKVTENNTKSQDMDEAGKPKISLKERCKEIGAIPFEEFKKEWMRQLHKALKVKGIH